MQENQHTEAEKSQAKVKKTNKFVQRAKALWNYFTVYEKIWYISILVLAIVFAFIFPEEDTPSQMLQLQNAQAAVVNGDVLEFDFSGTDGVFVVDCINIGDKQFAISDFCNYSEHTVDPEYPETLKLTLPIENAEELQNQIAQNSLEMECYADDDGQLVLSVTLVSGSRTTLFDGTVNLEEGEYEGYSVKDLNFLVPAAVITFLYVLDVILNITCELLISKQSKWNFIVSLGVEIAEIVICIVCMYRFATMATTLLFWIPCDIVSFVMWHRHPDKKKEELTVVKKLTWWQDIIIIAAIAVWTVGVGYLLTLIEIEGGIFANNVQYKNVACYLDACASAVGIANGLLILFRYREQWLAWYICSILETVINIMAGQWILLVLKVGYLTNTTYGYIMWTRYIRNANTKTPTTVVATSE